VPGSAHRPPARRVPNPSEPTSPARDRGLGRVRPRQTPKLAGLIEALVAFLVGSLLSSVAAEIAAGSVGYRLASSAPVPLVVTVSGLIGLWIGLVAGVFFYSRIWGTGSLVADVGLSFKWWDLVVGAVAGIGTQLVLIPLLYLPFERADPTLNHRLSAPATADSAAVHGAFPVTVLVLFLAVFAPVVEELFFRGLLLRSMTRWLGPIAGIAISAVVFGLAHFEPLQLAGLVLFGIVLGLLAYKTQRLGPGIVAHAAFNAVTVFSLVLGR
jgi:CAAX protease family protein